MDYLKACKDKRAEFNELSARMDGDKSLLYLTKYQMKDKNKRPIPNIINVTLNDPAVFAWNVIASLGSAVEQIVVESEDKKLDTHYIEEFQRAAFASADERLRKQGKPELDPFIDEQNCVRGRSAARVLFRERNGVLIPDILPLDTRFLVYDVGIDGLKYTGYEMTRSKEDILEEYPNATVRGSEGIVWDIWTPEANIGYVDDVQVREDKNPRGYVPVVIQVVPLGSMLADSDAIAHSGESIFFLIRDLIPEMNRLATIVQTMNLKAIMGAKQFASKEGITAKLPDQKTVEGFEGMVAVDIGGGITMVPVADIKRAASMLHSMIETRIQRGSLSSIDLGTLGFPLSAVALIEIGEGRDQIFMPRLGARGLLKQGIADMFTQQVIAMGHSVELGTPGHKRSFDIGKLQGEYENSYKYFVKSPKIDAARFSLAGVAERYYDFKTILSDVLQAEDPEGIIRKRYYDMAEKVSPVILKTRIIKALVEEGDDDSLYEAQLLSAEMGVSVKQIMAGAVPEESELTKLPTARESASPLLSLFAGGGPRTSAKRAAELKQTPEEGEE